MIMIGNIPKGSPKMSRETFEDILIWGFVAAICVVAVLFDNGIL